jgi:hypothetical protein
MTIRITTFNIATPSIVPLSLTTLIKTTLSINALEHHKAERRIFILLC